MALVEVPMSFADWLVGVFIVVAPSVLIVGAIVGCVWMWDRAKEKKQ
jgi:hypothetical protein